MFRFLMGFTPMWPLDGSVRTDAAETATIGADQRVNAGLWPHHGSFQLDG